MKRVNYHLTEFQIKKLKELSKQTGLSTAELIRRAIDKGYPSKPLGRRTLKTGEKRLAEGGRFEKGV